LAEQFLNAWVPEDGGGIPWRKQDQFFNAPANGPAGLFLARYLALVATALPAGGAEDETARDTAGSLVLSSAQAAWDNRATVEDLPLFSAFWERDAQVPTAGTQDAQFVEGAVNSSEIPERDLSVQLAGWMVMEAAHTVAGDRD
jgi:predicted alpha-1,6-mannanase (GH76 family)